MDMKKAVSHDEYEHEWLMIGYRISYFRRVKGYTQEQLADIVGTTTSYIGTLESQMVKPISLRTLFKIANALEVKPSQLLEFD